MRRRNTPNERLQAEAQRAIESNRFDEARALLQAAVKHDATDPRPWLMLAGIAPSARERRAFLAQAERLRGAQPAAAVAPPTSTGRQPASRGRAWLMGGMVLLLAALLGTAFVFLRSLPPGAQVVAEASSIVEPPPYFATAVAGNDAAADDQPPPGPTSAAIGTMAIGTMADGSTTAAIGTLADDSTLVNAPTEPAPTVPVKQIVSGNEPMATWTMTPPPTPTLAPTFTPTPTPEPTATPEPPPPGSPRPAGVGAAEKWIDVNLTTQTLVAYEGDTAVFSTLVSSGLFQWPTVTGQFRTYLKYESQTMNGYLLGYDYYLEGVPYVMYFYEDYAIHGAYWHNNFGTPMSHGCVNVSPADAGWLFNWAPIGTLVSVHY